jgi:signal peptidase I
MNSDNFSNQDEYRPDYVQKTNLRKTFEFIFEMVKVAIISLAIILPVRYFLIQPFYVKGASMEPNFYDHEYLIIDEVTYRFNEPKRGDIVVFRYPNNPSQYFIKRVIGLPGEKVRIEDNQVLIADADSADFSVLEEPYLGEGVITSVPMRGYSNVKLGEDEYYLLGDNRERSLDSRAFGLVEEEFIVGRTWLRGWPFNRLTVFNVPEYNL